MIFRAKKAYSFLPYPLGSSKICPYPVPLGIFGNSFPVSLITLLHIICNERLRDKGKFRLCNKSTTTNNSMVIIRRISNSLGLIISKSLNFKQQDRFHLFRHCYRNHYLHFHQQRLITSSSSGNIKS